MKEQRLALAIALQRARGLARFREMHQEYYNQAKEELERGHKRTHWIWFIFPQPKGLGSSTNSRIYALSDREARKYWDDPFLQTNTYFCAQWVDHWIKRGRCLEAIMGNLDAMKYRSFLDLFAPLDHRIEQMRRNLYHTSC